MAKSTKAKRVLRELAKGTLLLLALVILRFVLWHPGQIEGVSQTGLAIIFLSSLANFQWGLIHGLYPAPEAWQFVSPILARTFAYLLVVMIIVLVIGPRIAALTTNRANAVVRLASVTATIVFASVPVFCVYFIASNILFAISFQPWSPDALRIDFHQTGKHALALPVLVLGGLASAVWYCRMLRVGQTTGKPSAEPPLESQRPPSTLFLGFLHLYLGELFTWVAVVDFMSRGGSNSPPSLADAFYLMLWHDPQPLYWTAFAVATGIFLLHMLLGIVRTLLERARVEGSTTPPPAAPPGPP